MKTVDGAALYPLTLLYDGACPVCSLEMEHLRARNANGKLAFGPQRTATQMACPEPACPRERRSGVAGAPRCAASGGVVLAA